LAIATENKVVLSDFTYELIIRKHHGLSNFKIIHISPQIFAILFIRKER